MSNEFDLDEFHKERPWLNYPDRDDSGKYSHRLFSAFLGKEYRDIYGGQMESSEDVLVFLFDLGWAHYRFSEIYGDYYRPRNNREEREFIDTDWQLTRMGFEQMYNTPKLECLPYESKRIFVDLVEAYFPEDAGKYYYILDLNESGEVEE